MYSNADSILKWHPAFSGIVQRQGLSMHHNEMTSLQMCPYIVRVRTFTTNFSYGADFFVRADMCLPTYMECLMSSCVCVYALTL